MNRFRNIEALRKFIAVYECEEPANLDEYAEALRLLRMAYLDVQYYIKELLFDEFYFVKLVLPHQEFELYDIEEYVEEPYITLPFGTFSWNVWRKLLEDKTNPLFQLLEYFEFHTKLIYNLLAMQGVDTQFITNDLLQEYQIEDVFSLHKYVGIYDRCWEFTNKEG